MSVSSPPRTRHARSRSSDPATINTPATPATSDWTIRSRRQGRLADPPPAQGVAEVATCDQGADQRARLCEDETVDRLVRLQTLPAAVEVAVGEPRDRAEDGGDEQEREHGGPPHERRLPPDLDARRAQEPSQDEPGQAEADESPHPRRTHMAGRALRGLGVLVALRRQVTGHAALTARARGPRAWRCPGRRPAREAWRQGRSREARRRVRRRARGRARRPARGPGGAGA